MRQILPTAIVLGLVLTGCSDPAEQTAGPAGSAVETTTVAIISEGASIAGANGVYYAPDGLLYVVSVIGSTIMAIDPDSGNIVKQWTAADGVSGPDDIAFGPDGSFYWTSILTGEVAGYNAAGDFVSLANLGPGVNPITFSDTGRLFVSQCFLGDKLFELDPAGNNPPRLIAEDLGPGCGLNGMDWGPDGRLYGPRWFTGEIVSFNVDDNSMRVEATGFSTPASVKFDRGGKLHVLDTAQGTVTRIDGDERTVVATLAPGLDNFDFGPAGEIFVSSYADGFVKRINPDGSTISLLPGGMSHAGGITMRNGVAIVADLHALRAYDPETGELTFTQRNVLGISQLGGAFNVSADGDNLILTSWFDGDVRIWNPDTRQRIAQYTDVIAPISAVRYHDEIAVADHGTGSVVGLSDAGKTNIATGLPAPTGLVVEQEDLYVSDRVLGQILLIASNGKIRDEPMVVADGLSSPEGFVVTTNGFIVVEADVGRVVEVNSAGARRVLAEIPKGSPAANEGQPPSQVFNGITRLGENVLLVTGETNRSLYRIQY